MIKIGPKTMRFDGDVYNYVRDWREGENFSEQFHCMVRHFMEKEKMYLVQLNELEKEIQVRQERIMQLSAIISEMQAVERKYRNFLQSMDACATALNNLAKRQM